MANVESALDILTKAVQRNTEVYSKRTEQAAGRIRGTPESRQLEAEIKLRKDSIELIKKRNKLDLARAEEIKEYGKVTENTEKELKKANKAHAQLGRMSNLSANTISQEIRKREDALDRLTRDSRIRDELTNTIDGTIKTVTSLTVGMDLLTHGVKQLYELTGTAIERQVGYYSALTDGLENAAFSIGLFPKEAQELVAANRQIVNASGGVTDVFDTLSETGGPLYLITGSFKAANEAALQINRTFRDAGVRLDRDFSGIVLDTAKSLQGLQLMTGKTTNELATEVNSLINTESMRIELMRLSEAERKARVRDTYSLVEHYVALGKTTEGAIKMLDAMKSFQALSPRERLKEAAKTRAIMGAMGIAGGERLQELLMKPTHTAGDVEEIQRLTGGVQAELQRRAGKGGAQMFVAGALQEQLGSGMQGLMKETNMVLEAAKAQTEALSEKGPIATILADIKKWTDTIKPVFGEPIISMLGGVGVMIASVVKDVVLLAGGLKFLGVSLGGLLPVLGTATAYLLAIPAAIFGVVDGLMAAFTGDSMVARLFRKYLPEQWESMVQHVGGSIHWFVEGAKKDIKMLNETGEWWGEATFNTVQKIKTGWAKLELFVTDWIETIMGWFTNLPKQIESTIRGTTVGSWLLGEAPPAAATTVPREQIGAVLGEVAPGTQQKQAKQFLEQGEEQTRVEKENAREAMGWQKQIAEQLTQLNKTQQDSLEYTKLTEEEKQDLAKRGLREGRFGPPVVPYRRGF